MESLFGYCTVLPGAFSAYRVSENIAPLADNPVHSPTEQLGWHWTPSVLFPGRRAQLGQSGHLYSQHVSLLRLSCRQEH